MRKDKPHPVTGLSPGPQLIKDCVISVRLCGEKAVEVIDICHGGLATRTRSSRLLDIVPFLEIMSGAQELDILGSE